jgi:undecaprenyldiphospho-muramoylpentapeptide beta-N-acetylglucosaminyltransferase
VAERAGILAVVAGGGTAGHVLPALAVVEGLVARGHDVSQVHYIGTRRGVEARLVPPTGIPHTLYDVVGLRRSLDRRNLGLLPKLWRARRAALALLRELRPGVVVSVGGYASLPAVLAARRLRIPVVVVSYDRIPGLASRFAARRAAVCAVAFADSDLPRAVLTGAPVRRAVLEVDRVAGRAAARRALEVPDDRVLIAVMGGSLGSGVLNDATTAYVETHAGRTDLAVRHLCGERFVGQMPAPKDGASGILYTVIGFEDQMPAVYAAADLLVARGGASTVAEVAVTGIPAILVPWAGSAEDHQTRNVQWLSDQGAAVLVPEAEFTPQRCVQEIDRLVDDRAAREALGAAARRAGEVHRSGALARLVEDVATGRRTGP